mgnify:CR=1 FL=1
MNKSEKKQKESLNNKDDEIKKVKIIKKKIKKNITVGIAFVNATFNNTIVTITDDSGNVIAQSGTVGTGKSEEGGALDVPSGAVAIRIDTGQRVQGAPNTQPGGGI